VFQFEIPPNRACYSFQSFSPSSLGACTVEHTKCQPLDIAATLSNIVGHRQPLVRSTNNCKSEAECNCRRFFMASALAHVVRMGTFWRWQHDSNARSTGSEVMSPGARGYQSNQVKFCKAVCSRRAFARAISPKGSQGKFQLLVQFSDRKVNERCLLHRQLPERDGSRENQAGSSTANDECL
jgi:hypothetical protein